MPTKQWITSREAADILSKVAGRTILPAYVRQLAGMGHIRTRRVDARTKQYHRGDCESYHVAPLRGQRKQERVRDRPARESKQDSDQPEKWSEKDLTEYSLEYIMDMEIEWRERFFPAI